MGIGASIFLFAVGAILAFAVDAKLSGLDINVVGWILMLVSIVGLALTLTIWSPRRRIVVREDPPIVVRDPAPTVRRREPSTTYRRVEEREDVTPPETL